MSPTNGPTRSRPTVPAPFWIYDFGLHCDAVADVDTAHLGEILHEAFAAVWRKASENDGFNRLVMLAGLPNRDVAMLRAYAHYLRQVGSTFSQTYMQDTPRGPPRRCLQPGAPLSKLRFDPAIADNERERADELAVRSGGRHRRRGGLG